MDSVSNPRVVEGVWPGLGHDVLFDLYLTRLEGASELYSLSLGSAADASIC